MRHNCVLSTEVFCTNLVPYVVHYVIPLMQLYPMMHRGFHCHQTQTDGSSTDLSTQSDRQEQSDRREQYDLLTQSDRRGTDNSTQSDRRELY